jgi:hypothetical protein
LLAATPGRVDAPRLVHTDMTVEIPEHALLTGGPHLLMWLLKFRVHRRVADLR